MPRPRVTRTRDQLRMFPGWAESVLWLHGPLSYPETGLPAELVADLERWDLDWSRSAHPDAPPPSRQERRRHRTEGARLAALVREHLAPDQVLEVHLGRRRRRLRGRGPDDAPLAGLVRSLLAEHAAEQARIQALLADGAELYWSADPPDAHKG